MLKAKLLAMCVCPALAAPPAILAVSPPARHAVAHVLHHAANRLEPRAAVADAQQLAALSCAPSLAAGDGALPVIGSSGEGLGGLGVANLASVGNLSASSGAGQVAALGSNTGYGGGGYGSGFAGGGGGISASPAVPSQGSSTAGGETMPAPGSGSTNNGAPVVSAAFSAPLPQPVFNPGGSASTAPEPAAWMLMMTGFGLVGAIVRVKRPAATVGHQLTFQQAA